MARTTLSADLEALRNAADEFARTFIDTLRSVFKKRRVYPKTARRNYEVHGAE